MKRLGLIDWGVGGMSVVRRIRGRASLRYVSDTGAPPYGKLSAEVLTRRVEKVALSLLKHDLDALVVACNAASTVVPQSVQGVRVFDVISPVIAELNLQERQRLGVIGGGRTIASGVYQERLLHDVTAVVAQPLSALVERGELAGAEVERAVGAVLAELGDVDALVLACTHYPALEPVFRKLSPELRLVDPAQALERVLASDALLAEGDTLDLEDDVFMTTGDPDAMMLAANRAFGLELGSVGALRLPFPKSSPAVSKEL